MKTSIIIPVYNAENSLRKCVESLVFGQEEDIEIILVEDCSQDHSWEVCKELAHEYQAVKCIQNLNNKGVSYTRNQGIKISSGKYILFVDSDDWVSGKYVRELLNVAEQNPNALVVCGFFFIDEMERSRKEYVWQEDGESFYQLSNKDYFLLQENLHLQQLWNKIFLRDVIYDFNVCFDEKQTMGEDFQFVLDYIQAAQIKECIVINQALYYYIRVNKSSLMSKFGLTENENEFQRLRKLRDICGIDDTSVEKKYKNAVHSLKNNYIYQICRSSEKKKKEQIELIEHIVKDGKAKLYFKEQKRIIVKEKLIQILNYRKEISLRVKGRIQRYKRDIIVKHMRKKLSNSDFSIISQNCIGGVFYHDMHMRFLSPTINLFFKEPDFVRFVQNLEHYINTELKIVWGEEYPIGYLDDILVYFMHYQNCSEAKESWEKRKQRINWNKIIVIATDMEGFNEYTWKLWEKISYPKILFSVTKQEDRGVVTFPEYKKTGHVEDLIPDRKFYKDGILIKIINNVANNSNDIKVK